MRVLFIPGDININPHQGQLAKALEKLGLEVRLVKFPQSRLPLLRAMRVHGRPDVVHLHWIGRLLLEPSLVRSIGRCIAFIGQVLLMKALGVRVVWTVHDLHNHRGLHPHLEQITHAVLVRIYDRIIIYCDRSFELVATQFRMGKREKARIVTTRLGNYIGWYPQCPRPADLRARWRITDGEVLFLHFGQIRPDKGVPELLDVFRRLDDPRVRLVVAGRPATEEQRKEMELRATKDPRIHLVFRWIQDAEVQEYMEAADAVVLPYKDGLNSSAALLAMSFAKALIAPRIGCIADVLDEEGSFFYDPSDESGLQLALERAASAPLHKMGQHNFELAKESDWALIAQQTYAAYSRPGRPRTVPPALFQRSRAPKSGASPA